MSQVFQRERLAAKAAREMGYAQAVSYAEEKLHEEVLTAVVDDARKWQAHLEESAVLQMWLERKVSRYRVSSYGLGTWLLGEDAALAARDENTGAAALGDRLRDRQRLSRVPHVVCAGES